jgi:hypothetical protein
MHRALGGTLLQQAHRRLRIAHQSPHHTELHKGHHHSLPVTSCSAPAQRLLRQRGTAIWLAGEPQCPAEELRGVRDCLRVTEALPGVGAYLEVGPAQAGPGPTPAEGRLDCNSSATVPSSDSAAGPDRRAAMQGLAIRAAPRHRTRRRAAGAAMVARPQSRQSVSRVVARQLRRRSAPARRRLAWLA